MAGSLLALALLLPLAPDQPMPSPQPRVQSKVQAQDLCWSPDGRQLFFSAMRVKSDYSDYKPDNWGVYRYDLANDVVDLVTASALFVSLSPSGDRLAVGKLVDGNRDVYLVDLQGKEIARLTSDPAEDFGASWSPDGRQIAFTSKRDGQPEVYVVDQDGRNLRRLTSSGGFRSYNPAWSPDGRHIAYYLERGDHRDQIYVMRPDGSGAINVTSDTMNNVFPGWTPDGRLIYGQGAQDRRPTVVTVRPDGSDKRPLLDLISSYARYSPDGSKIAVIREGEERVDILASDGTPLKKVSLSQVSLPPPCSTIERHQFDFWIGRWIVRGPKGRVAGTNEVTSIMDGCAVRECWSGVGGMTGTSLNAFDPSDGRWHQTWVDDKGLVLLLSGGLQQGRMVLMGEAGQYGDATARILHRITWEKLDDGHVRQVWESSDDRGQTWSLVFDGRYERADPAPRPE